jgi:hypothetical protein
MPATQSQRKIEMPLGSTSGEAIPTFVARVSEKAIGDDGDLGEGLAPRNGWELQLNFVPVSVVPHLDRWRMPSMLRRALPELMGLMVLPEKETKLRCIDEETLPPESMSHLAVLENEIRCN